MEIEMTLEEKKELNESFKNISDILKYYVFLILKEKNIEYTQNENGIFFNDNVISDAVLIEIRNFINSRLISKTQP